MQRIIFDLDGTLLNAHWDEEKDFFIKKLGSNEKTEELIKDVGLILAEFENKYFSYNIFTLNNFMNKKGYDFTPELVLEWVKFSKQQVTDDICDGVIEMLELCMENDIKT